jgi:predicted NAD/FAD-dependent oxidoreductase
VHDVIVVGAGITGLQCGQRLRSAGADVLLVDRADKAGGRCATRSFDGQPFDYGPLFIHGDDPEFLASVGETAGVHRLEGWPRRIQGTGTPCQPDAFAPSETRCAFAEGLNAYPQSLASGLSLRLNMRVTSLSAAGGHLQIKSATGETFKARDVVLAMALEQSMKFLGGMEGSAERDGMRALLGMFVSVPCLTVIARYAQGTPEPEWDVWYPEDDDALLLICNDSAKRPREHRVMLVCQAAPRWSHTRLEAPREDWSRELLAQTARRVGAWAASPELTHIHRWRYARLDRANELAGPVILHAGGGRVGLAGDLFAPGGGMQAAWLSGNRLAMQLT